ncbi:hypothetical protein C6497_02730 [Candidatus Poribacteria bacterium]|nr:MAG: hypothetical protein C6497_02730 [Candidatus Poribacteria bacterium]
MIKENIYTVIQKSIISHILPENSVLRNPSKTLFYIFTQIRKLSLNIGGYLLNSEYTKIGVTEKSYDFVTFSHNSNSLFINCPIQSNHLKNNPNAHAASFVVWTWELTLECKKIRNIMTVGIKNNPQKIHKTIGIEKEKNDTKISIFTNSHVFKTVSLNPV